MLFYTGAILEVLFILQQDDNNQAEVARCYYDYSLVSEIIIKLFLMDENNTSELCTDIISKLEILSKVFESINCNIEIQKKENGHYNSIIKSYNKEALQTAKTKVAEIRV